MADTAALKNTAGTAFDTAYIAGQVAGHIQMEQVMQTEIQSGSDPDLKAFAGKTLPVVQDHLKMAQQLQAQSKASLDHHLNCRASSKRQELRYERRSVG